MSSATGRPRREDLPEASLGDYLALSASVSRWMAGLLVTALFAPGTISAQNSAGPLAFEVASVKPAGTRPATGRGIAAGLRVTNRRASLEFVPLKLVIQTAYGVRQYQVAGPDWLVSERFNIDATLPEGATRDQVPEMLRTLLAERFQFVAHRETRTMPVYYLVIAKNGPKIQPATSKDNKFSVSHGPDGHRVSGQLVLANLISVIAKGLDRPVLDMTGLEGYFDVDLRWLDETARTSSETDAAPLFTALQETLGLKLESRKGNIDVVVVDRVERAPTEN